MLLVVPPMASLRWPSFGVHLLQALARQHGHAVDVLYANVIFGSTIGIETYQRISNSSGDGAIGERLFARAAFGLPPIAIEDDIDISPQELAQLGLDSDELLRWLCNEADQLVARIARLSVKHGYSSVGSTSTFAQHVPSLAILKAVKFLAPEILTLLGGANCESPMGFATAKLCPWIDFVFAGESEATFVEYLCNVDTANVLPKGVVPGRPLTNLDSLPRPDYAEYFDQSRDLGLAAQDVWIPFESSRGCWWGAVQHCTFCGLNGSNMGYRVKTPQKVANDIEMLLGKRWTKNIAMVDNIMPSTFYKSLMPLLSELSIRPNIFYEQKSNISIRQMFSLARSGVTVIQAGIESLSTSLLRRMKKGVTAQQNIASLRFARSCGVTVHWNLLCALPGDKADEYRELLSLFPLLHHLQPPSGAITLSIDRFSPYFENAATYGISDLEPTKGYRYCYPEDADLMNLAYHFTGKYESDFASSQSLQQEVQDAVKEWRNAWLATSRPILLTAQIDDRRSVVIDTRSASKASARFVSTEVAAASLLSTKWINSETQRLVVSYGYACHLDDRCVGLATSHPEYLLRLTSEPQSTDLKAPIQIVANG